MLGAGVLAVPRRSLAQQQSKVGFLYHGSRQSSLDTGRYNAFVQGMRELGYVEGTNFVIEARFADGKHERLPRSEERRVGKECRSRWSPYH